jgi:flagellar hook-associated protein 3 FlgL
MIGRITQQMTSQMTINELTQSLDRLDTTQQQLSTGKRINQPSDDPYGASQAITLSGDLSSLTSYSSSVSDGTAWTTAASTSMTNIDNIVQRVRELTVGAANGTNSASSLSDSAAEVNQLIASVKQEANTQYSGQYIFGGTGPATPSTTTPPTIPPPYDTTTVPPNDAYSGNSGAVNRTIGPGSTIQVNTDVSQLLGNGQPAAGQPADGKLLDVLRNIAADMSPGGNIANLGTSDLTGIDASLTTLGGMQATAGATTNRLELATSRISNLQISDTQALSDTQDANMASTITDYSNEQASYTAALKASANIIQQSLLSFLS